MPTKEDLDNIILRKRIEEQIPMKHGSEAFIAHTDAHIERVRVNIKGVCDELYNRGVLHDQTKFTEEEASLLSEYQPRLQKSVFRSEEYQGFLEYLKPALSIHYSRNRHHPEHFKKGGMNEMNLIDIMELLCDWFAATKNHDTGNILVSIEKNQTVFGYTDEFKEMLKNTARYLGWVDN